MFFKLQISYGPSTTGTVSRKKLTNHNWLFSHSIVVGQFLSTHNLLHLL